MWLFKGLQLQLIYLFFFFNDTATTEIYTLSLHDALPICAARTASFWVSTIPVASAMVCIFSSTYLASFWTYFSSSSPRMERSEEHTSELQSQSNLVCRLLLEKKKISVYMYRYCLCKLCHV